MRVGKRAVCECTACVATGVRARTRFKFHIVVLVGFGGGAAGSVYGHI